MENQKIKDKVEVTKADDTKAENLPQIFMRHPDITNFQPIALPYGCGLHGHIENEKENKKWEDLTEKAFERYFSFEELLINWKGYKPEYVLYLSKDGKDIATASGVESEDYPNEGYVHMVATLPGYRGLGAGRIVMTAVLQSLAARGFKSAVLSTDDERLAAIKLYYKLGFRPMYTHESHKERWEKIFKQLNIKN